MNKSLLLPCQSRPTCPLVLVLGVVLCGLCEWGEEGLCLLAPLLPLPLPPLLVPSHTNNTTAIHYVPHTQ
jgi:hypothetical protein